MKKYLTLIPQRDLSGIFMRPSAACGLVPHGHDIQIKVCHRHALVGDYPDQRDAAGEDTEQECGDKAYVQQEQPHFVPVHDFKTLLEDRRGAPVGKVEHHVERWEEGQGQYE